MKNFKPELEIKLKHTYIFLVTVEPRQNEVPMDWQNLFTIMRFRYIKVLFHIILPLLGVKKLFTEDFARVSISTDD